jgi:hypothetical protein
MSLPRFITLKFIRLISFTFLLLQSVYVRAELPQNLDSIHNPNATTIIKDFFSNTEPKQYLLLSESNVKYIIIEKKEKGYVQHFIKVNHRNQIISTKSNKVLEDETVLNRAFQKEVYRRDYVNLDAPLFQTRNSFSEGSKVYFYYKHSDGRKYGEASLTSIIHPNPIDLSIFGYLMNKLSSSSN